MFNASVMIREEVSSKIIELAQELAQRAVKACGMEYNFDGEEAIRLLGLNNVKENKKMSSKVNGREKRVKAVAVKASFPLPYNGEYNENCCDGLRHNNGLYTQCQLSRKGDGRYCKGCQSQADKNDNGKPDYGTIQDRNAVGIFEFVDPSGKHPTGYLKVMNKLKLSKEDVLAEAEKLNIKINEGHFEVVAKDSKRGRPKVEKEPKEKQAKGRPKKSKKVVEIADDLDDLFANMVISTECSESEEDEDDTSVVTKDCDSEKDAELAAEKEAKEAKRLEEKTEKEAKLAAEKAEKEAKRLQEKAEKEAKLAAEKAEKEAKRLQEKAEKEAKLAAEKAEKEAKEAKRIQDKAEKEAKLAAEKEAKEAKEAKRLQDKAEKEAKLAAEKEAKEAKRLQDKTEKESSEKAASSKEPQVDKVKKITYEGATYLKSSNTGVVYNMDQDVVGKWDEATSKIIFAEQESEEEEEDYDEEEEE